ncbi:hypothetical protein CLV62_12613 [Dysgonomonas alginatilytica]|uniref:Uncharacterized protein n=1 Tax=Dysgonomonas alginatilytica TaxID=1605892 RepID=A0A2V3PLZ5_9BACT|nr:hypothetical protein CLV62_12613 [Dysgonomonas alginatilytica]
MNASIMANILTEMLVIENQKPSLINSFIINDSNTNVIINLWNLNH